MASVTGRAIRETVGAFRRLASGMEDMHSACQVRPSDPAAVLRCEGQSDGSAKIFCQPVVCRVPERATQHSANLYVVLEGWVQVGLIANELVTLDYSTNFGYFLIQQGDRIMHALGGHYDYATDAAHPRAHMQLASQAGLHASARELFKSIDEIPLEADLMLHVLHRVRTPTAQMDFLSFMLQIAADHLVGDSASEEVFVGLCACAPLRGFATSAPLSDCHCQRAAHWYPT